MIRDITLGQFFPGKSLLHRLDPRVKLLWVLVYIILLFLVNTALGFTLYVVITAVLIKLSGIRVKMFFKGMRPIVFLLVFTAVINMFMTAGEPIFKLGFLSVTKEGIRIAVFMALRLMLLVTGTSLLTFTTSPIMLTDAIERILSPFSKIGVPADAIAMMMTIAIRFIPTILEETDKIIKAQKARGADFESGNILARAKAMTPILIPLFISAFRRADELAVAMECRCYHGGEGRTRLKQLKISKIDIESLCFIPVLLILVIFSRQFSLGLM
ncbi:MAG: energy-coupling factor transporter transmembrane protein EcfT [Clostridia bacterium]|nr:energy-coupling factor transporter transmembrane protein EcfT [Clostridia bacterium]